MPRYCDETYRDCREETRYREDAWTAGRPVKVLVTNFGDVKAVRLQGP